MKKHLSIDFPNITLKKAEELTKTDLFLLTTTKQQDKDNFYMYYAPGKQYTELVLNADLPQIDKVIALIQDAFIYDLGKAERKLNKIVDIIGEKGDPALTECYLVWRDKQRERRTHDTALEELSNALTLADRDRLKLNMDIVRDIFYLGYGVYQEGHKCDTDNGARDAFLYGYLVGVRSRSK